MSIPSNDLRDNETSAVTPVLQGETEYDNKRGCTMVAAVAFVTAVVILVAVIFLGDYGT